MKLRWKIALTKRKKFKSNFNNLGNVFLKEFIMHFEGPRGMKMEVIFKGDL